MPHLLACAFSELSLPCISYRETSAADSCCGLPPKRVRESERTHSHTYFPSVPATCVRRMSDKADEAPVCPSSCVCNVCAWQNACVDVCGCMRDKKKK